jgi:hypothetical protein
MPAFKGTKALPHSGNPDASYRDKIATSDLIQARLNNTTRRKYLEKKYGKEEVDANVRQLEGDAAAGRRVANAFRGAKKMAKGGSVASKRADGCATKGKTKGKFV